MSPTPCNIVYIATSLDGLIAGPGGDMGWLPQQVDEAEAGDYGFAAFIGGIDAVVMGRRTFDTVADFDPWPYPAPVFVLSRTLRSPPAHLAGRVRFLSGPPPRIVAELNGQGFHRLYIDGGETIRQFLDADLIDRMILTQVPVLLGGGAPLFGALDRPLTFLRRDGRLLSGGLVMTVYDRDRQTRA